MSTEREKERERFLFSATHMGSAVVGTQSFQPFALVHAFCTTVVLLSWWGSLSPGRALKEALFTNHWPSGCPFVIAFGARPLGAAAGNRAAGERIGLFRFLSGQKSVHALPSEEVASRISARGFNLCPPERKGASPCN